MKIFLDVAKGISFIILIFFFGYISSMIIPRTEKATVFFLLLWLIPVVFIYVSTQIYSIFYKQTFNYTAHISGIIFLIFIFAFYFIPLLGKIPEEAINLNTNISIANENDIDYAKELFYNIEKKWDINIRDYFSHPIRIFLIRNHKYYWNLDEGEYADSGVQAIYYRDLLLKSNRFTREEVKIIYGFCTNSIHPYIHLKLDNADIYADFFAVDAIENYQFGQRTQYPCDKLEGKSF